MATHTKILAWEIPWTEEPGWGWGGHKSRMLLSEQTATTIEGQKEGILGSAAGRHHLWHLL